MQLLMHRLFEFITLALNLCVCSILQHQSAGSKINVVLMRLYRPTIFSKHYFKQNNDR